MIDIHLSGKIKIIISNKCVGFPGGSSGEKSAYTAGDIGLIPGLGKFLDKWMATHSSILAWRFHVQRNLVGNNPCGCTESDTTEHACL